jgi:hypothetical protein
MEMIHRSVDFMTAATGSFRVQAAIAAPAALTAYALDFFTVSTLSSYVDGLMGFDLAKIQDMFLILTVLFLYQKLGNYIYRHFFRVPHHAGGRPIIRMSLLVTFFGLYTALVRPELDHSEGFGLTNGRSPFTDLKVPFVSDLPFYEHFAWYAGLFMTTMFGAVGLFCCITVTRNLFDLCNRVFNLVNWEEFIGAFSYSVYFDLQDYFNGVRFMFAEYFGFCLLTFCLNWVGLDWTHTEFDFWLLRGAVFMCNTLPEMDFEVRPAKVAKTPVVKIPAPIASAAPVHEE